MSRMAVTFDLPSVVISGSGLAVRACVSAAGRLHETSRKDA